MPGLKHLNSYARGGAYVIDRSIEKSLVLYCLSAGGPDRLFFLVLFTEPVVPQELDFL